MRGVLFVLAAGCGAPEPPRCEGEGLFGLPDAATGLTSEQCAPACPCGGETWSPPDYGPEDVAALRAWTLLDPPASPESDPYVDPPSLPEVGPDAVCAVVPAGGGAYHLRDFPSTAAALADGATPTHYGACGLCSALADLAVYMERPDLTEPVRACGLANLLGGAEALLPCLEDLGFTRPCAWIWAYNTRHTQAACASECFAALEDPYHLPDGSLNPCLQCDEEISGPIFHAVAGRTRRNTGLPSSMCRPCTEVRPLVHAY